MPYSKINPDDMILRDHLAYDRTVLANERTLLSYIRTAIALLAAGGTLIKIFPDDQAILSLGIALTGIGLVALVTGICRFVQVTKKIGLAYETVPRD